MGKKKYYMVLDTETVADARIPFDIAWTVIDRKGEIIEQSNYFTEEIVGNPTGLYLVAKDSFSKSKAQFYFDTATANPEMITSFEDIIADMKHSIRTWNNAAVVAYNARFDVNAINNYARSLNLNSVFTDESEIWDLWNIALYSLCNSKNYVEFSLINNFITEAGNVKSSAEAVFNYLLKDGTFEEAHTALADTEIEAKILYACFKRHKKLQKDYAKPMFAHPIWKQRLKLS